MSSITDTVKIVLQKGIEGGFAPPTPHALYTITCDPKINVVAISSQFRPHGAPQLSPPNTKELSLTEHAESITKLQGLLRDIPTQHPGAQDLYGRNTSIVLSSPEAVHISGSAAGQGILPPTEEQKTKFDEAVGIIENLGAVTL